MERLNTHEALYGQLVHSLERYEAAAAQQRQSPDEGGQIDGYSEEAVRVGRSLRHDFEKAGIHLPAAARARLTELTGLERRLGIAIGGASPIYLYLVVCHLPYTSPVLSMIWGSAAASMVLPQSC